MLDVPAAVLPDDDDPGIVLEEGQEEVCRALPKK
jgi:hypothetical protein